MHLSRRGSLVFLTSSVAWTPGWTVASHLIPADAQVAQAYLLGRLLVLRHQHLDRAGTLFSYNHSEAGSDHRSPGLVFPGGLAQSDRQSCKRQKKYGKR